MLPIYVDVVFWRAGLVGFKQHVGYASGQGSPAIRISVRASINSKRDFSRWEKSSGAARNQPRQTVKEYPCIGNNGLFYFEGDNYIKGKLGVI